MKLSFFLNKFEVIQHEFLLDRGHHIATTKIIRQLGNLSWNIGILCALKYRHKTPQQIITLNNIKVVTKNSPIISDKLLLSSFCKISNQIALYQDSIDSYLTFHTTPAITKTLLTNLLLSHEIFHFLQCHNHCIMFDVNCLNEIAAYAFAKNLCNLHI